MALNIGKLCTRPTPKISYDISPYSVFELLDTSTLINDQWHANHNHKLFSSASTTNDQRYRRVCKKPLLPAISFHLFSIQPPSVLRSYKAPLSWTKTIKIK